MIQEALHEQPQTQQEALTPLLRHWHPVLRSRLLKDKPVRVEAFGRHIVIFRTRDGVAALDDRCPHRGMSLSRGTIAGDRLVCSYHGWNYGADGQGSSPSTPRLHPCVGHYEVLERHHAIWLRAVGSTGPFPDFSSFEGYDLLWTMHTRIEAPLEMAVDNFTELEHTGFVHKMLGFAGPKMQDVRAKLTVDDDVVRVDYNGPLNPMPYWLMRLMSFPRGVDFAPTTFTIRFEPLYIVTDSWWVNSCTGEESRLRVRFAMFFTPVTQWKTDVMIHIFFVEKGGPSFLLLNHLRKLLVGLAVNYEFGQDRRSLLWLSDLAMPLEAMQLGRLDASIQQVRKRIQRLYRGEQCRGESV